MPTLDTYPGKISEPSLSALQAFSACISRAACSLAGTRLLASTISTPIATLNSRVTGALLQSEPRFKFMQIDIADRDPMAKLFADGGFASVQGPVHLADSVSAIKDAVQRKAQKRLRRMQPGDVPATYPYVSELTRWTGFKPGTPIAEGVGRFVEWYRSDYNV